MFTEQQMTELMEIRKQMDALQARYDAIMKAGSAGGTASVQQNIKTPASAPATPAPAAGTASSLPQAQSSAGAAPLAPAAGAGEKKSVIPLVVTGATIQTLRNAVISILSGSRKPMPFEAIFDQLVKTGAPLPADKPMLVVRKVLHDRGIFKVLAGTHFDLVNRGMMPAPAIPAEPAQPQPQPQPEPQTPSQAAPSKPVTPAGSFQQKLDSILGR